MVPIVELRGAIPIAEGLGFRYIFYYPIAIIGNMLPVPIIFLFARKVLEWGKRQKNNWKIFYLVFRKGEKVGKTKRDSRRTKVYFLLYFYLLVSHYQEQVHGQEH